MLKKTDVEEKLKVQPHGLGIQSIHLRKHIFANTRMPKKKDGIHDILTVLGVRRALSSRK